MKYPGLLAICAILCCFVHAFASSSKLLEISLAHIKADLCTFDGEDFHRFEGSEWFGEERPGHFMYVTTFCKQSTDSKCTGSICQYDKDHGLQFIGSVGSFVAEPLPTFSYVDPKAKTGLKLTFANGEKCDTGVKTVNPIFTMAIYCDPDQTSRRFFIYQPSPCTFEAEFYTKLACP